MARKAQNIELSDGEPRKLRFTFGPLDRIREKTGLELEDFRDKEKMTTLVTRNLPLFIWAALTKEHRAKIDPEEIADLIDVDDLPRITEQLMAAMGGGPDRPTEVAGNQSTAAGGGPISIDRCRAIARIHWGLGDGEFWRLTLDEYAWLADAHFEREQRADYRAAVLAMRSFRNDLFKSHSVNEPWGFEVCMNSEAKKVFVNSSRNIAARRAN